MINIPFYRLSRNVWNSHHFDFFSAFLIELRVEYFLLNIGWISYWIFGSDSTFEWRIKTYQTGPVYTEAGKEEKVKRKRNIASDMIVVYRRGCHCQNSPGCSGTPLICNGRSHLAERNKVSNKFSRNNSLKYNFKFKS